MARPVFAALAVAFAWMLTLPSCLSGPEPRETERDGYALASPVLQREIDQRVENLPYVHGKDLQTSMARLIYIGEPAIMNELRLDPARQLVAAQCSGTLVLAKLGLLGAVPACTDPTTKLWVQEAGVEVLNQSFFADGNVATAGGCMASPYLAAWIIGRTEGRDAAASALHYVAPVGEKEDYVARAMKAISAYL